MFGLRVMCEKEHQYESKIPQRALTLLGKIYTLLSLSLTDISLKACIEIEGLYMQNDSCSWILKADPVFFLKEAEKCHTFLLHISLTSAWMKQDFVTDPYCKGAFRNNCSNSENPKVKATQYLSLGSTQMTQPAWKLLSSQEYFPRSDV